MKKYIVVYTKDRESDLLGVFDTVEDAHEAMKEDFQSILDDYPEWENDIEENCAWINEDDDTAYDWNIFEISI